MTKDEFKAFCDEYFKEKGFKKTKKTYYLLGDQDVLGSIDLQKSNYGDTYYVNCCFYIGDFSGIVPSKYPIHYDHDIYKRIPVMSKKQTINGKRFETCAIEYEEYTPEELLPFFDHAFETWFFPPLREGKKYFLAHIGKLYHLDLKREVVMAKLKS